MATLSSLENKHLFSSWVDSNTKSKSKVKGSLFYVLGGKSQYKKLFKGLLYDEQLKSLLDSKAEVASFQGPQGFVWIVTPNHPKGAKSHEGLLDRSPYCAARDLVALLVPKILSLDLGQLEVHFEKASKDEIMGLVVGLEMGQYKYREVAQNANRPRPKVVIKHRGKTISEKLVSRAINIGLSANFARHLVNMPANRLDPKSYSQLLKDIFAKQTSTQVEVWDHQRLKKEKMGLHVAVGQAAEHQPCLVRIKYRPRGAKKKSPIAIVGKGITFDSGGLDIKPAQYMRNMKKDMGGSASVAGVAYYVISQKLSRPYDFYFAIAENAIASNAFRPGDILTSKKGTTVEIHNTDAEGRLVLADALTVAVNQKPSDKPQYVFDLSTLTGAIKATLGATVGGLFSNNDALSNKVLKASYLSGDKLWRVPLIPEYRSMLKSTPADMSNCSDGFGGAVTAALFLEHFVEGTPWVHMDLYAWADGPSGGCMERGGNGQAVQCMAFALETL